MSTGVGMSDCCLSGKIKEGKPKGREEVIGGLHTYVAEPENRSKEKTVIFLVDIFGWEFVNTRLLADIYAKNGFYVYIPDVLEGDSINIEFLNDCEPPLKVRENLTMLEKGVKTAKTAATLGPWLISHREAVSKPIIDGFINAVRMIPGTDKVGTIGWCWGGRYSILAAHNNKIDAAVAQHPSLVAVPADFDPVSVPLSVAVGDQDSLLSMDDVKKFKEILDAKSVPTEVTTYHDQVHGFALRGDWSSEKDAKAMDDAEKQGIAWFKKYL